MIENKVKRILTDGGAVLGTWLSEVRTPAVVVALARSGIDFVIMDTEHSHYNLETVEDLCVVANEVGLCVIVRIQEINQSLIGRILDAGAQGLMVPRIRTRKEVETAVAATRFPPRGRRGFNLGLANTRFNMVDLNSAVMRQAEDEILVVIQIEEQEALEHVDELVSVAGVDVAFVGPADLSISLGIPGEYEHPDLVAAVHRVVAACQEYNIIAGIPSDGAMYARHLDMGLQFLAFGGDLFFIQSACSKAVSEFRSVAGRE